MQYQLIRSNRKTIGIQIRGGEIVVRAPFRAPLREIEAFLNQSQDWIEKTLKKQKLRMQEEKKHPVDRLTPEQMEALAQKALKIIPERVKYYAPLVGVDYGRITIRNQRTRWGSCSSKGNLNFNCLLCLAPPEVLDSVVVHELCHRLEMNHTQRFYDHVLRVYPDYFRAHAWLKEHGTELMKKNC